MTLTIAGTTFDNVSYDADADVLYLHVGEPSTAVEFDATPEGHALRYDAAGALVGLTIVGVRQLLDQDGTVRVTIPAPVDLERSELAAVLAA